MAKKDPKPKGRPSSYTQEMGDVICERLIDGQSLRTICDSEDMPSKSMVCRWLASNEQFRDQYARAREMQADILADETLDIADDGRNDWMERFGRDGEAIGWQVNGEAVSRSKIRVEARRWYAGKLAPKKYGDKLAVGGADDLPPIQQQQTIDVSGLSTQALAEIMRAKDAAVRG